MTPAAKLLERLERTRVAGAGRWMSLCPAHPDRVPSLSIRELSDGRLLVHCFAGCQTSDVLAALGLELRDLFSEEIHRTDVLRRERSRRELDGAEIRLSIARSMVRRGERLTDDDIRTVRDAMAMLWGPWR